MSPSREQLEQWDRDHVWHPFTPMQNYAGERPIIIKGAQGCLLVDLDGREYIDGVSSLWCNVHGHRVPALDQAVREQLDRVAHTTLLGLASEPSIVLARRLVELAPPGLTRVFYSDDGATAAAVVIEPLVQGAAGMVPGPEGFLRRAREVTAECDVLLIADEVAVGFGRTGTLFACAQEGVTPDFLCLAKGLTGGYLPLAATLTTERVFEAFLGPPERTFFHGHTYTGNPLGCAVALASLDLL